MYNIIDHPEIHDNFFLGGKGYGASKRLTGNVNIITVFMKRSDSDWQESTKYNYYSVIDQAAHYLMNEAKKYGAELNITCYYLETTVSPKANPKRGFSLVKQFFHKTTVNRLKEYYKNRMGGDEFPLILAFNEKGRSFSFEENYNHSYHSEELSVIFYKDGDNSETVKTSIAHELLHQFGAVDYYFPQEVKDVASKYFANSIMGIGAPIVDDLTAYLIGWKDTVSANSYWFLKETMWVDEESNTKEIYKEWERPWD